MELRESFELSPFRMWLSLNPISVQLPGVTESRTLLVQHLQRASILFSPRTGLRYSPGCGAKGRVRNLCRLLTNSLSSCSTHSFIFISTRDHKFLTFPKLFRATNLASSFQVLLGFQVLLAFSVLLIQLFFFSQLPIFQNIADSSCIMSPLPYFLSLGFTPLLISSLSFPVSCREILHKCFLKIFPCII